MKVPKNFIEDESVLDPFVIAAGTNHLDSACDLLFIHGSDLTWGQQHFGFFLVSVSTDENFDEVIEVVEARSKLIFGSVAHAMLRRLEPRLIEMLANVAPELEKETDAAAREKILGSAIATEFTSDKTKSEFDKMAPEVFGVDQWMSFADSIAGSLLRDAISLRQRQIASTGKTEEDYDGMLYSLQRLALCDRIVRIAYPSNSLNLELSVASQGEFNATEILDGANVVEWLRLKSGLASLKIGQEKALPLFIAAYINRHFPGPRQAFACAKYGEQNQPDLDVVIPALAIGFEVKLYQAPFAITNNKVVTLANELKQQLPSYARAGCERVCYVSNLSQEMAESVLKTAQEGMSSKVPVVALGAGIGSLISLLDEIGQELEARRQQIFEQKVQRGVAAAGASQSETE
jgi:hypothetical protein